MTHKAEEPKWDGEELFIYSGMLVWVIEESLVFDFMRLAEFPGGTRDIIKIPWQTLPSATPEDLEEAGV